MKLIFKHALNLEEVQSLSILDKENTLVQHVTLPQKVLTLKQEYQLFDILLKTSTYGGTSAACFEPRWAFVFYKDTTIVGAIDICMECNILESNPAIAIQKSHHEISYYENEKIVVPFFGFSPRGRKKLKQFCHDLQMTYCSTSTTMFD